MFQFPGLAPLRVTGSLPPGSPIRTPPDLSLLAAPRGFSQLAASFIAGPCQGIRRVHLLRLTSPLFAESERRDIADSGAPGVQPFKSSGSSTVAFQHVRSRPDP